MICHPIDYTWATICTHCIFMSFYTPYKLYCCCYYYSHPSSIILFIFSRPFGSSGMANTFIFGQSKFSNRGHHHFNIEKMILVTRWHHLLVYNNVYNIFDQLLDFGYAHNIFGFMYTGHYFSFLNCSGVQVD